MVFDLWSQAWLSLFFQRLVFCSQISLLILVLICVREGSLGFVFLILFLDCISCLIASGRGVCLVLSRPLGM